MLPQRIRKISYSGIFIAMIMAIGYTLAYVPNFELVTTLIFLSGYFMGIRAGLMIGLVGEFLFSAFNPMGSGLNFPPMLIAQIFSMGIAGICGGVIGNLTSKVQFKKFYITIFGITGLLLTIIYTILVSMAFPISAGLEWNQVFGILLSGVVFSTMHIVMNFMVFTTLVPLICIRINKSGIFNEIKN